MILCSLIFFIKKKLEIMIYMLLANNCNINVTFYFLHFDLRCFMVGSRFIYLLLIYVLDRF